MKAMLARPCGLLGVVWIATALAVAPAVANEDAAHALAEKFSHASDADSQKARNVEENGRKALERKLEEEERLKADEAEMLARAKAEAEARKAAEAAQQAEAERRRKDDERLAAEKAAAEKAIAEKAAADRLAVEKAAAEKAAAEKAAADRLAAEQAAEQRKAEEERLAAEKAAAERKAQETAKSDDEAPPQAPADANQRAMEAEREEEARRLSEKLKRAREQREMKGEHGYSALGNPPAVETTPPRAPQDPPSPAATVDVPAGPALRGTDAGRETRATILLVMEPGSRGIRRYDKTADPVLCVGEVCYISNGPDQPATRMTRGQAFGPGRTLGQRAGACRKSLTCVFRDVEILSARVELQPVDLRILRHDRREPRSTGIDPTCIEAAGHLRCSAGVVARTYRLWVVPESLAENAGPAALSAALDAGLPQANAAQLRD